jgi:hypothetical protein
MATILIAFIYIYIYCEKCSWTTALRRPWCFVGVGWGMCSRSCELAHEVDATLWLSVGACIHVHDRSCELAHEVDATL